MQPRSDKKVHEHAQARETHGRRAAAYQAFLARYDECHNAFADPEVEETYGDLVNRLRESLLDLETCASSEVLGLAQAAPEILEGTDDREQLEDLRERLAAAIRSELDLDAGTRRAPMSEHIRSARAWRHLLSGFALGGIVGAILGLFIVRVVAPD